MVERQNGGSALKDRVGALLFAFRFLLMPLYLGLAVSLVALLAKAGLVLYSLITKLQSFNDEGVLLSVLAIVDMTLVASLVMIVVISGYTNFVASVPMEESDGKQNWIAQIDFSDLKLKLMASIVAISAIKLLEGFMDVPHVGDRELGWLIGIHLTFVASTLALAVADRLSDHPRHGPTTGL